MKTRTFQLFILGTLFLLCAAPSITFKVLFPAPIDVPQHIQRIGLIDRSVPDNKILSIIEGGLTGEGIGQDKLGTQFALDGLNAMLQNSLRFHVYRTTEAMIGGSAIGAQFPDPLPWGKIEELCYDHDVDAIISLEKYDSDFIVTNASKDVKKKNADGQEITVKEFTAQGVTTVRIGFRMYDPKTKSIFDQHLYSHNNTWEAGGSSAQAAVTALISKDAAVKDVSYNAGFDYGRRISPSWYNVSRHYFRRAKGDDNLFEGALLMESNDWDNAKIALEIALENGHKKVRGKAAHNLAVIYEINGDLDKAKEYASLAWGKYKENESRDYGYELTRRMQNEAILDQQLQRETEE